MVTSETWIDPVLKLRLIPYNLRLVNSRKEREITQADLALLSGIATQRIGNIETLRVDPVLEEKEEIASALGLKVDYLFPEELYEALRDGAFKKREEELTSERLALLITEKQLLLNAPFEEIEAFTPSLKKELALVISSLRPREKMVIEKRFGLNGEDAQKLEAVGRSMGATGERIRQIELKALRRLRHPSKSRRLKTYLYEQTKTKKITDKVYEYHDNMKVCFLPLSPFLIKQLDLAGYRKVGQLRKDKERLIDIPHISGWSAKTIKGVILKIKKTTQLA